MENDPISNTEGSVISDRSKSSLVPILIGVLILLLGVVVGVLLKQDQAIPNAVNQVETSEVYTPSGRDPVEISESEELLLEEMERLTEESMTDDSVASETPKTGEVENYDEIWGDVPEAIESEDPND